MLSLVFVLVRTTFEPMVMALALKVKFLVLKTELDPWSSDQNCCKAKNAADSWEYSST